jgi:hypothetical protein
MRMAQRVRQPSLVGHVGSAASIASEMSWTFMR